jgi:hypothetical protein
LRKKNVVMIVTNPFKPDERVRREVPMAILTEALEACYDSILKQSTGDRARKPEGGQQNRRVL